MTSSTASPPDGPSPRSMRRECRPSSAMFAHRGRFAAMTHDEVATHDSHGADPLTATAIRATAHCLTGCAIGEVLGLVLATWWGWGNLASIFLAIALAFVFGYSLTIGPVLRA